MKDIKGYEGLYAVTSCGKVWSYRSKKFLSPATNKQGYYFVLLYDADGNKKGKRVNRLVAETYIPNPDNLPIVGHANDIKKDNRLSNLYWTDHKENAIHNDCNIKRGKKVRCVETGEVYDSMVLACQAIGEYGTNLSRACRTGIKMKGCHWEYVKEEKQ